MFEKWRKDLDKGGKCGALFIDISNKFDRLQHDLLLVKLNTHGFSYESIKLRRFRSKIYSEYRDWDEFLIGVPKDQYDGLCCLTSI